MSFNCRYDPTTNRIIVSGEVEWNEVQEFRDCFTKQVKLYQGTPANWHAPLMGLVEATRNKEAGAIINAIKLHRHLTGAGMKEAKDYIEALAAGTMPGPTGLEYPDLYSDPDEGDEYNRKWFEKLCRLYPAEEVRGNL